MLEGRVFVLAVGGELKRPVQSLFEIAREHGSHSFTPEAGALSSGLKNSLPGRLLVRLLVRFPTGKPEGHHTW
jgi:hypothetical protein